MRYLKPGGLLGRDRNGDRVSVKDFRDHGSICQPRHGYCSLIPFELRNIRDLMAVVWRPVVMQIIHSSFGIGCWNLFEQHKKERK